MKGGGPDRAERELVWDRRNRHSEDQRLCQKRDGCGVDGGDRGKLCYFISATLYKRSCYIYLDEERCTRGKLSCSNSYCWCCSLYHANSLVTY